MIAMQYVFTLPADYDMGRIVDRVLQKGAFFDDFPGLVLKAFLMSEAGRDGAAANRYAPFYVWHSPDAMRDFLAGPGFAALVASFGRPQVRTWLPLKVVPPSGPIATLDLLEEAVPEGTDTAALIAGDHAGDVVGLDPAGWRLLRVRFDAAVPSANRFRVLHLSQPAQR
jgi:Domain of unknown function (DUF4865)